ncbi:hypothetical protein ABUJ50_22420, partial [Salmonella enterica subsp. enterica serovar Agama]
RRILHAADATGKEVETTLVSRAQNHPNIQVLERSNAVDLIISIAIAVSFMPLTLPERKSKPRWSVGRKIILIFRCWNAATPLI